VVETRQQRGWHFQTGETILLVELGRVPVQIADRAGILGLERRQVVQYGGAAAACRFDYRTQREHDGYSGGGHGGGAAKPVGADR